MRVGWLIPCRYVEVNDNLATIVGAGIDRIFVPTLPAQLQVLCALRLVAGHDEIGSGPHKLACRVFDPQMQLLSELHSDIEMGGEGDPTIEPAIFTPMGVVFAPTQFGQHTIEVAVDDRGVSVPMTVAPAPPLPPTS